MTNTEIDMSQGQFDDQHPAGHTAKLFREAEDNVTVMLQAADLLRDLGYDNMAIALHARTETTGAAIANATREVSPDLTKPIVIEVRGGVVQDVLNVPSGIEYEVRDYDND
jgi:hypothetical protein